MSALPGGAACGCLRGIDQAARHSSCQCNEFGLLVARATVFVNDGSTIRSEEGTARASGRARALPALSAQRSGEPDLECAGADLCRALRSFDPRMARRRHPWTI